MPCPPHAPLQPWPPPKGQTRLALTEVQQLQAVQHALVSQLVHHSHDLAGAQPKLGTVACRAVHKGMMSGVCGGDER